MQLGQALKFLELDPQNLALIGEAASAAFDAGQWPVATNLLAQYETIAPLPASMRNLAGLVAMNQGHLKEAVANFETVLATEPSNPEVRFNLAWTKSALKDWAGASSLLDQDVAATVSRAAALKIQMLHHMGEIEEALAWGADFAERQPGDKALMAALAVAAIDADELELARSYAERADDVHEGLSTLGMLALGDHSPDAAMGLFDRAIDLYPDSARARLGKGLGLLALGDPVRAARELDHGAEVFGDHLGSWVASGWAYFVCGDNVTSRHRFERALTLDDTFAETHGALAVLDIVENNIDSARKRTDVALRLDRQCFAGILAKTLLLTQDGDLATAERLRTIALNSPVGPGGQTIAQSMVAMGMHKHS